MPTLTDFQKLRSGYKEEFELYSMENRATMLFYKVFLPCVGSVKIFGNHVFQKKLSSIFSISQEGYVLLELSNNYRVWMIRAMQKYGNCDANDISETQYNQAQLDTPQEYLLDERRRKGSIRGTRWTQSRYYATMDGWSEEGIQNYNMFCLRAKMDRRTDIGIKFETNFLEQMKRDKNIGFAMNNGINSGTYIAPYSDLFHDDEVGASTETEGATVITGM